MVLHVVRHPLLEPAEQAHEPRADPQQRGHAPPGVRIEGAREAGPVQRAAQRAAASPHRAEADAEGEQVERREHPTHDHRASDFDKVRFRARLGSDESLRRRSLRSPPVARLAFHQRGQPPGPRYLWPREQVFHPPRLARGMSILRRKHGLLGRSELQQTA